jgi:hypothetical protein
MAAVVYSCHPKLPLRQSSRRSQFQDSLGQKFLRPHLNRGKLGVVAQACHPSYCRKLRNIVVQAGLGKK